MCNNYRYILLLNYRYAGFMVNIYKPVSFKTSLIMIECKKTLGKRIINYLCFIFFSDTDRIVVGTEDGLFLLELMKECKYCFKSEGVCYLRKQIAKTPPILQSNS